MTSWKRLNALLIAFATVATLQSRPSTAQDPSSNERVMKLTPVEKYVLDFSPSEGGGVPGGNFDNFAFNIDPRQPVRKISMRAGDRRPDVIATYDYADCTKGQESLLEQPVRELAAGSAAWVDYVEIEMIPLAQRELKWAGGVCYGYRNPDGKWHWHLATTPLTYDPATDRVRARLWVKQANIDALKLVFDYSVPRQSVSSVTVATRPPGGGPGQ
jgi:hypothetical protein